MMHRVETRPLQRMRSIIPVCGLVVGVLFAGCSRSQHPLSGSDYRMGEHVPVGTLVYTVLEESWKTQLGDPVRQRFPQSRFLVLAISVTNGGGGEVTVPLLSLENTSGQTFTESDNGEGVDQWLGLLRTIQPAQTIQGKILFDVQPATYRLRVTDGGEPGQEKIAKIYVPLSLDVETPLTPGPVPR